MGKFGCVLLTGTLSLLSVSVASARETIDFDFGWRFAHGPILGAEAENFYDGPPEFKWRPKVWEDVDLPHDFQFGYKWDENANRSRGYKPMGEGIYRKHFYADPAWKGLRVALDFGGILCLSEVYLNGRKVAENDYGYLGFEVPVEKFLRYGETNVVAVKASTGHVQGGRWYTGAGLYRSVKLIVRDEISVTRHGVFVTTPAVSDEKAEVAVQVELDGWRRQTNDLEVAVSVRAPNGTVVGTTKTLAPKMVRLPHALVKLPSIVVSKPVRWDLDRPALYVAEVTVSRNGRELDRVNRRFGIRTVEFDRAYGFRLNGRKVFLQSMCNHHDLGGVGAAAYRRAIERQVRTMKTFGYNAIRCSHNPYSEDLYEVADELGLLVVDELVDKWGQTCMMGRPMCESFFDRITEWVRRDRNHPSVILWSLGNEMQHEANSYGFQADDWGITTFRIFDVVVKRWDPTRKTTAAMYPAGVNGVAWNEAKLSPEEFRQPPELCRITDVASINYRPNLYKTFVEQVPHLNIFQSEATVLDGLVPFWQMDREHSVGLSYWGAIAYWGESGGWPMKGWNYSFFDHDLRPRPTAWQIRTAFVPDEPQVRVAVDEGKDARMWNDVLVGHRKLHESWNRKPGDKADLTVFTNCETVELMLNGRSLGVRKNDATEQTKRNVVTWKGVAWEAGRLEAVARNGGREVARHAFETTGAAVRVRIEDEDVRWTADGHDLKYLQLTAVDEKGRVVPEFAGNVRVTVTGAGSLIALDDGDQATDQLFNVGEKRFRDGRLLAIVRAGLKPGEATVKVEADGLGAATQTLRCGGVLENRQEKFGFSLPQTLDASMPRSVNADCGWIQRAIDAAAARGGGRVTVPAGVHRTGTIWLRSHVELHLEKGAVLEASTKLEDYDKFPRNICPITPEFCDKALVCAANAEDIAITGEGTIDGRGPEFYERTRCLPGREPYVVWEMKSLPRPRLIQFVRCRNVRVAGVTLKDAPAFTAYVRQCENVEVGSVTVVGNPRMPNNDGFDFDACRHVRVGDSTFFTGDDCFAFRAVREKCDPNPAVCEDVIVSNCSLRTHCQAIRIGCPSDDTIRNLLFKNIRMAGKNGVYFGNHLYCVRRDEEGYLDVSDVRFENFTGEITHSAVQMLVDPGIRLRRIDGISFKDFNVRTGRPLRFVGNAFSPLGKVSLENFTVTVVRTNALVVAGAPGLVFTNVVLNGERIPDGPVAGEPGSSAPLVRKPPISWDNRPESSGAVVPDHGRLLTPYDFSDPTVWQADDGRYYATATTLDRLLVSWDLFRWEDAGRKVVSDETRRQLNEIALRDKERGRHVHLGLWAPDVVRVGKRWIMTLAARTSGQNAKIVALAADRPEGPFADPVVLVDGGKLQIADAIDPEIVQEGERLWLFFGSLGGIHRIELAADCRSVKPGTVAVHVAGRRADFRLTDVQPSRYSHFEGAYLFRHDGWWYLFASGGRYADESYRLVVGRSRTLDGPFVDRQGRPMTEGAGETILSSEKGDRYYGPGHNGEIFTNDGRWWMFYHVHDRKIPGNATYVPRPMAIQEIKWEKDGWPFFETGRPQLEN